MASRFASDLAEHIPDDPEAVLQMLRAQLVHTPDAVEIRRLLADFLLGYVDSASHHLMETVYLDDPDTNQARLAEVRELLGDDVPGAQTEDPLIAEARREQELLDAWRAFESDGGQDFPQWCSDHGVEPPVGNV
ncbi:MAG: hypothetical protein U0904_01430, partial [Candidatus Nanopelagicales bacterium]|nr:hypothetical protein [Candidatus Nanopelagicales bacterium]